jgi:hypothetical protein
MCGGFVAAGVADGLVAFPVAPGRAGGDDLTAMSKQVADDGIERVQLASGRSMSQARMSWPSPR